MPADIIIGLDVGWSERRRSTGIALVNRSGQPLALPGLSLLTRQGTLLYGTFTFTGARTFLHQVGQALPQNMRTVMIIDGPLGANGPPLQPRLVDAATLHAPFAGLAMAGSVTAGNGPRFVQASYGLIDALGEHARKAIRLTPYANRPLTIIETNPTVGLSLLVPRQEQTTVPTRRSPRRWNNNTIVRTKSDWYWLLGAGQQVANTLGCEAVASVTNHELRAALYCAAVGMLVNLPPLAEGGVSVGLGCTDGPDSGIYAVLPRKCVDWVLPANLITFGTFEDIHCMPQEAPGQSMPAQIPLPFVGAPDDWEGGDDVELLLCDDAGVWQTHNPWLEGVQGSSLRLTLADGAPLHLVRADREDGIQWTALDRSGFTAVARRYGFQGDRLSLTQCMLIPSTLCLEEQANLQTETRLKSGATPRPLNSPIRLLPTETAFYPGCGPDVALVAHPRVAAFMFLCCDPGVSVEEFTATYGALGPTAPARVSPGERELRVEVGSPDADSVCIADRVVFVPWTAERVLAELLLPARFAPEILVIRHDAGWGDDFAASALAHPELLPRLLLTHAAPATALPPATGLGFHDDDEFGTSWPYPRLLETIEEVPTTRGGREPMYLYGR